MTELVVTDQDLRRTVQVQKVVDSLASGRNITEACAHAGVSLSTWRSWRRDGIVSDAINAKYSDVTMGFKDIIADSLVDHVKVLCEIARGQMPKAGAINGKLAPRDVIEAGKQLFAIWQATGGDVETQEREQQRILEELRTGHISITQVHVQTINVGTQTEPMPVPAGIIEGKYEEGVVDEEEVQDPV